MAKKDTITQTITINAPLAEVWRMLTDTAKMEQWMSDFDLKITTDWQVGSPITFKGDLHGIHFINKGEILELDTETNLAYTFWSSLSQIEDIPENYTTIRFQLTFANNQTILTFTQSGLHVGTILQHNHFYWRTTLNVIKKFAESNSNFM